MPTEIYDNTSDSSLNGANFYALDEEVVGTTSNLMLRENNPQLYDVAKAFEDIEMCIKMTLLGNFYSTYFMPLHLDLFHSTVERIVFANTTKCLSAGCLSRKDVIAPVFSMKCYTGATHKQIEAVHCYVSPSTVFGVFDGEHTIGIDFNTNKLQYNTIEESFMSVRDVFGAVVPMHVVIDKHIANGDFIKSEFISLKKEGERAITTASAVAIEQTPDNGGKYDFYANFIIPSAGKWEVTVVFETAIGISYKKTMRFDVADCADNPINLYLVERCDENELEKISIEYTDDELLISKTGDELVHTIIDGFSFSQVGHDDYRFGEAFIACSRSDDADVRVAGVNHLVMAVIDNNVTTLSTPSFELAISSTSIDSINQHFPEYLWFIKETYIRLDGESLFEKKPVIIGLRKAFSNETNEPTKVSVSNAYNGRRLSTDVFVPAFHKLNPDFTYNDVKQGMVVMAVPSYSIMKNADGIGWLFKNASTGEQWSLQSNGGELVIPAATAVGKQSFSTLTPGYYDISLSYQFGDEVKTHSRKRAFLLQR